MIFDLAAKPTVSKRRTRGNVITQQRREPAFPLRSALSTKISRALGLNIVWSCADVLLCQKTYMIPQSKAHNFIYFCHRNREQRSLSKAPHAMVLSGSGHEWGPDLQISEEHFELLKIYNGTQLRQVDK